MMTREEKIDAIYNEIYKSKIDKYGPYRSVSILDVLGCYKKIPKAEIYTDNTQVIVNMWKKKHEDIEEQDDECIDFIYWLLVW